MSLLPCATYASPDVPIYAKLGDDVHFKSVTTDSIVTEQLDLNGQAITASATAIYLNGTPYGGGGGSGVNTVTGSTPITVGGTQENPVVGINLSGIVQTTGNQDIDGAKKFTTIPQTVVGATPVAPNDLTNKAYVDAQVATVNPANWSQFPATQDVAMNYFKIQGCEEVSDYGAGNGLTLSSQAGDLAITASQGDIDITCQNLILHQDLDVNGYNLNNVGDINGTTSNMTITADNGINVKAITGLVEIDGKNVTIKAIASSEQVVSDSELLLQSDNNMHLTTTNSLTINAGSMNINNTLSMTTHRITNTLDPVNPQDVATKNYVDTRPAPATPDLSQVLTAGNSAGSSSIDMNGNPITGASRISLSGLAPTITTSAGSLSVGGLLNTNITSGGIATLTAPVYVSIGSAGYTTIENLHLDNSVISKQGSSDDLQFENVESINPTSGTTLSLGPSVELDSGGQVSVNTNGQNLSLVGGNTSIQGNLLSLTGSSTTVACNAGAGNPLWLQTTTANNTVIGAIVPNPLLDDSSVLQIDSDTRGIYIPRLTSIQRESIPNPQNGLMVYDTTIGDLCIYGPRGWAKVTLTDLSNNLLENLNGADNTKTLSKFGSIDANIISANTISALDPLVQPYIGVVGNLSFPGEARVEFGAVNGGDGTIKAIGNLNLQSGGNNTLQLTNSAVILNQPLQTSASVSINGTSSAIKLNGDAGTAGQVLTSNGIGTTPEWASIPANTTVSAGTNISITNTGSDYTVNVAITEALDMNSQDITNVSEVIAPASSGLNIIADGQVNITSNTDNVVVSGSNFAVNSTNQVNITGTNGAVNITATNDYLTLSAPEGAIQIGQDASAVNIGNGNGACNIVENSISLNASNTISLSALHGLIVNASYGSSGYVLTSQGPGLPMIWSSGISTTGGTTGITPLLVRSAEGVVSEGSIGINNNNGVLY